MSDCPANCCATTERCTVAPECPLIPHPGGCMGARDQRCAEPGSCACFDACTCTLACIPAGMTEGQYCRLSR